MDRGGIGTAGRTSSLPATLQACPFSLVKNIYRLHLSGQSGMRLCLPVSNYHPPYVKYDTFSKLTTPAPTSKEKALHFIFELATAFP